MMITTAILGMIATLTPTYDRGADPNHDRNINSENDHDTDSRDDHLIAITIPIPAVIGMLNPRMIAISTQGVMTTLISRTVTITISDTWYRLSGTPELMAAGSQCETALETQEMPDLLAT
ncbi:unnamed protein product [Phytophthora fragariaefolia]|uniref:Unnamed protein product n=1 Tax=Phytophthora fragariaefolia TaxID=1490495 RepID=A0A9W6WYW3_9STRA|nr:unnamed protein product [Phytophthora fragariaefolia]